MPIAMTRTMDHSLIQKHEMERQVVETLLFSVSMIVISNVMLVAEDFLQAAKIWRENW